MAKVNKDTRKILIIDDDSQIRNHLRLSLLNCGIESISNASNAKEGVALFAKTKPDITFLDINLPDKDGISVLAELLELDRAASIVMLSGDSTINNVKKSIAIGAKGFIVKPFSVQKIIDALAALPLS